MSGFQQNIIGQAKGKNKQTKNSLKTKSFSQQNQFQIWYQYWNYQTENLNNYD